MLNFTFLRIFVCHLAIYLDISMSFLITLLCSGGFQTLEKEIRSLLIQFNDEYLIYTRLVHYNNVIQLLLVNGYYALFWSWFFFLFLSTGDSDPMPEMMTGPMTGNVNCLRYTLRSVTVLFHVISFLLRLLFSFSLISLPGQIPQHPSLWRLNKLSVRVQELGFKCA